VRRKFLAAIQQRIKDTQELHSLPVLLAPDVFAIPAPVAEQLRSGPGLDDDAMWEAELKRWGALSVNVLTSQSVSALIRRGRAYVGTEGESVRKVSAGAGRKAPSKVAAASTLPPAFRGPFDWHLDSDGVNVIKAWDMFSNRPEFQAELPWRQIRIGHIDTGYTEHTALGWVSGKSQTVDFASGFDFWNSDSDPRDELLPGHPGHGTRISSTIAGFLVGDGTHPYYGAAPGVTIVPFRVTDSVIIDHVTQHVGRAIKRAVDDGCGVLNISLGAMFGRSSLSDALDYAYKNGAIVFCAAGNVWREVIYPGRYNRCITMAGTGISSKPWGNSARGQYIDLCAPSDQIRRVRVEDLPAGQAAGGLEPKSDGDGTSYATALGSGVAALWLAYHGAQTLRTMYAPSGLWQIPSAFKMLLRKSARTPPNWDTANYGSGIIDAAALLALPLPADGTMAPAKKAADVFDPND
jgi:lambda repressor-like predicted transcriptional regulator